MEGEAERHLEQKRELGSCSFPHKPVISKLISSPIWNTCVKSLEFTSLQFFIWKSQSEFKLKGLGRQNCGMREWLSVKSGSSPQKESVWANRNSRIFVFVVVVVVFCEHFFKQSSFYLLYDQSTTKAGHFRWVFVHVFIFEYGLCYCNFLRSLAPNHHIKVLWFYNLFVCIFVRKKIIYSMDNSFLVVMRFLFRQIMLLWPTIPSIFFI